MVALSLPRVVLGRARIRIGSVMGIRQAVRSAGAVALLSLLTTAPPWAGQAPGFGSIAPGGAGFSAERLLIVDAVPARPQSPVVWEQVAEHLRNTPGV